MSRKNTGKSTSKKYSSTPPKAAVAAPATVEVAKVPVAAAAVVAAVVESAKPVIATAPVTVSTPVVAPTAQAAATDLHSIDAATRAESATALGKAGSTSAVPELIAALHDGDADVAREAATALGTLGDNAAVMPLIAALDNVDGYFHAVVRAAAAFSVAQLGDLRAIEPLLNTITDPSAEVSAEAIRGLATLGDASVVDALIDVTRNRAGFFLPIARHAAVLALAKLGGEKAQAELREVANDRWENPVVRDAALTSVVQESTVAGE